MQRNRAKTLFGGSEGLSSGGLENWKTAGFGGLLGVAEWRFEDYDDWEDWSDWRDWEDLEGLDWEGWGDWEDWGED